MPENSTLNINLSSSTYRTTHGARREETINWVDHVCVHWCSWFSEDCHYVKIWQQQQQHFDTFDSSWRQQLERHFKVFFFLLLSPFVFRHRLLIVSNKSSLVDLIHLIFSWHFNNKSNASFWGNFAGAPTNRVCRSLLVNSWNELWTAVHCR